jgi:hypothetical protein
MLSWSQNRLDLCCRLCRAPAVGKAYESTRVTYALLRTQGIERPTDDRASKILFRSVFLRSTVP